MQAAADATDALRIEEDRTLDAARAGDRDAFERLARAWWDRIKRYSAAAVGADRELAEEAAQDALVRLFESLPKFRGDAAFGTFVYRICRNAAIDAIRRRARERKRRGVVADGVEFASAHRGPEEDFLRGEAAAELREALGALGEEDRGLLYLREAEGLGMDELGTVFGIPAGTVKSRLFRAKAKLRGQLREGGDGY